MKTCLTLGLIGLLAAPVAMAQTAKAQASAPTIQAYPYDKAPWWMKESVITQTGYVFTEVPSNRASFSATFLTVNDSLEKAQAEAINKTRALQQALGKLGKDKVRVTTSFSMRALYEQYRDANGNRIENQRADKINGYQVSLNISVEIRDMSQLERAYALVLAASPTSATDINFSLQASNEDNTWLYNEAVKDARKRASDSAVAAGAALGKVKVIDPTGRACESDILARAADSYDPTQAQEVAYSRADYAYAPAPPVVQPRVMAEPGSAEYLEQQALKNPFIQTPPLRRLDAKACVVYGLN